MRVDLRANVDDVIQSLGEMQRRQAPFALRLALQRTAEEARDAVRNRIHQRGFRFRTAAAAGYLANAIIIERPRSGLQPGQRTQFSIIAESKVGSSRSRSLLPWLEEGGLRRSRREIGPPGLYGQVLAVPLRPSPMQNIKKELYPAALRLQASRFTVEQNAGQRRGVGLLAGRLQGKRRTFLLPDPSAPGRALILQRTGPGRRDVRALFVVRPEVRVAGRAYFFSTIDRTYRERLVVNFRGALQAALFSGEIGRKRDVAGARWQRGGYVPTFRGGGAWSSR